MENVPVPDARSLQAFDPVAEAFRALPVIQADHDHYAGSSGEIHWLVPEGKDIKTYYEMDTFRIIEDSSKDSPLLDPKYIALLGYRQIIAASGYLD